MLYSQIKAAAIPAALVATLLVAAGAGLAASGREPQGPDERAVAAPAPAEKEEPREEFSRDDLADLSPEQVLGLIHEACGTYLTSMEEAQLDGAEFQGDEPMFLKVLESHVGRVEELVDSIRSTSVKDPDSRALLAIFADDLARERAAFENGKPGFHLHNLATTLEDAYSKFRRSLQRAREEDSRATDAAGKAKALERLSARGALIATGLREKAAGAREMRAVLLVYAHFLSKFSALDDRAAFHRVPPAAGPAVAPTESKTASTSA